jgi:ribosomal protein L11 methyltransferase
MGAPFVEVTFALGELEADSAYAACVACGAIAVTFTDAGDTPVLEPLPGEFRLWSQTQVCALFPNDESTSGARLLRALALTLARSVETLHIRVVPEKVWEREWLQDFRALRFGQRLWVCPRHERVAEPAAAVVYLDPGLAFGTGGHATTALCLEWLDGHVQMRRTRHRLRLRVGDPGPCRDQARSPACLLLRHRPAGAHRDFR